MITNPEAVKFSNERVRLLADLLCQLYFHSKAVLAEYEASGISKLFDDNEIVDDGSSADGRHPITGLDVKTVVDLASQYVSDFESGINAKLDSAIKVSVNPER